MISSGGAACAVAQDVLTHPGRGWQWRFACIFGGQAMSLIGSAMTQFVLLWWITDHTGSVEALGLAGVAAMLPQALISPLGGTLADRYSRRVLMIASDTISALCMLVMMGLFATGTVQLWHAYAIMALRSAMQGFQAPAAEASVAMLVPASFLPRAAGLNQTMISMALVASAPLGALAISLMPLGWALGIDVLTAMLGVLPLLVYRIPQTFAQATTRTSVWHEFGQGVQLIWGHPGLCRLYALLALVMLVIMPSFTLVPLLVKEHFAGGAAEVAGMEALAGLGMMLGAMLITALAPRRQMPWVLGSMAVSCLALGLTGLAPGRLFGVAVVWWGISGGAFSMGNAPLTALLQTIIPNHMQGRALSLLNAGMGITAPLGLALATPLGELIGVRWLFVVLGVVGSVVCLLGFLSPTLRRLDDAKPSDTGA